MSVSESHIDRTIPFPKGLIHSRGWEDVSLGQTHLGELSTVYDNPQTMVIPSKYLFTNNPTTKLFMERGLNIKTRLGKY